ncbi:MAG: nickel responsive regulator [Rhodospirillales bacterium 69-11]|nr:nickel-responsive transcriptional regulator NikR [Rhodospirillales bacterium]MBN8909939.1 nickel-responsive transcriptional regulator NikR [Rhodospirillales bacterium]MBN8926858.1 nickel-responsive transcriptional regulator NikR [Rhodospirillales bacterium]OJW19055.1 MAG: nickel responsive regulator [Rhodospirillales bacterium 69-11]
MQRITITMDDELLAAVDALMARRGYASRSEAFRDIVRGMVDRDAAAAPDTPCVATLTYVYDHETRALAQRLTRAQHDRHDLMVANLHVHLDHEACLEIGVLRGTAGEVTQFADQLTTQRGVRHAALHVVPVTVREERHTHGGSAAPHTHLTA